MTTRRCFVLCSLFAAASAVSAQPAPPGPTDLDHFNCYFTQGPTLPQQVLLLDEFDTATANPFTGSGFTFENVADLTPFRFCNPVQKTTSSGVVTPILYGDAHLLMYRISNQPDIPRVVTIQNQFTPPAAAATTLITGAAVILAVPSGKALISSTAPPALPTVTAVEGELDHFKCYHVTAGTSVGAVVTLVDQFSPLSANGGGVRALVLRPYLFCNPVLKIMPIPVGTTNPLTLGGGITTQPATNLAVTLNTTVTQVNHPEAHLTCYLTASRPSLQPLSVFYDNQCTPIGTLPIVGSVLETLCVPSFKLAWSVLTGSPAGT
jgi:hypothetical protein